MEGINEYILDRPIADLTDASIREFWDYDYDKFAREYGIVRNFPGEVFYHANNNKFLDRECFHTVVAARDGKIYKILFRFISRSTEEYVAFQEDAYDYLTHKFGNPSETRRLSEFHKISVWDGRFGNVILEIDMLGVNVIYTSSMLRKREKKKSLLGRLFGS